MRSLANIDRYFSINREKTIIGDRSRKNELDLLSNSLRFVYNNLPKFKPFIFSSDYFETHVMSANKNKKPNYLPFKHCSFDFSTPLDGEFEPFGNTEDPEQGFKNPLLTGFIMYENDDLSIDVISSSCDRLDVDGNPEQFNDITKFTSKRSFHHCHYSSYEEFNSKEVGPITILRLLSSASTSIGSTINGFRFAHKSKHPDFVKRLIVIGDKRNDKKIKKDLKSVIDWQHQWRVRGHWRKVSDRMIGKDREGEYCIVGRTWVKDFVKGDGPLIEKTRIYKGDNNVRGEQSNSIGPTR